MKHLIKKLLREGLSVGPDGSLDGFKVPTSEDEWRYEVRHNLSNFDNSYIPVNVFQELPENYKNIYIEEIIDNHALFWHDGGVFWRYAIRLNPKEVMVMIDEILGGSNDIFEDEPLPLSVESISELTPELQNILLSIIDNNGYHIYMKDEQFNEFDPKLQLKINKSKNITVY